MEAVKAEEKVHLVVLVMNLWTWRFDNNIQKMLRIFYSMFKHANMWDNFAVVFTRCINGQTTAAIRLSKQEKFCATLRTFVEGMGARMACNPFCCFIDCHPQGPDNQTKNERAAFAGYLASLSPMSTSSMEDPGEYMQVEEESEIVITQRESEPIFETHPIIEQVPILGKSGGWSIGFGGFSVSIGEKDQIMGYKNVNCGEVTKLVGEKVREKGVLRKREKRTWFDGKTVSYLSLIHI